MVQAIRADLADAIAAYFADKPRIEAQAKLGLSQAIVSQIMNGRVDHLSVERLMRAMVRAGIPGYAQWPNADLACGGVMRTSAATVTLSREFDVVPGPVYPQRTDFNNAGRENGDG